MLLEIYTQQFLHLKIEGFNTENLEKRWNKDAFSRTYFYILQRIFGDEADSDFQIICPEYRETDLLFALCLLKFKQNDTPSINGFKAKSRWFHPRENIEYEALSNSDFRRIEKNGTIVNERRTLNNRTLQELIELPEHSDIHERRTVKQQVQSYFELFRAILPNNVPCLTRFNKRILVVADRNLLQDSANLPIRYNDESTNLPIESLIHIVPNWEIARDILREDTRFEELIIIGTRRYREHAHQILSFKNQIENLHHIVFIGEEKVQSHLKTWDWTLEEVYHLKNDPIQPFERHLVEDKKLHNAFKELKMLENALYTEGVLSLNQIKRVTRSLFNAASRHLLPVDFSSKKHNDFWQKCFDDFVTLLKNIGKTAVEAEWYRLKLETLLETNFQMSSKLSSKLETILNIIRREERRRIVVITDKDEQALVQDIFERKGLRKAEAVTVKQFTQRLAAKEWQLSKTLFIFPYVYLRYETPLYYYNLYKKSVREGAKAILLHYSFEHERLIMFEKMYEYDKLKKLTASDRAFFIPFTFEKPTAEVLPIIASESFEAFSALSLTSSAEDFSKYFASFFNVFADDFSKQNEHFITEIEAIEKSKLPIVPLFSDRLTWRINFVEGGEMALSERAFLVKENKKQATLSELKIGDRILYFDIKLETSRPALREIEEAKKVLKRIDEASRKWHECLKSLQELSKRKGRGSTSFLKQDIDLSVSADQIEKWLNGNSRELFPRLKADLEHILTKYHKVKPEFGKEQIIEILACYNQAGSLREVVTKLNIELQRFTASQNTEGLSILSQISKIHLEILLKTKTSRTIKTIEKICPQNEHHHAITSAIALSVP